MIWLYLWLAFVAGELFGLGLIWLGLFFRMSDSEILNSEIEKSIFEKKQAD